MGVPDRRRDERFTWTAPAAGALRAFSDVLVQQDGADEWIGIDRQLATIAGHLAEWDGSGPAQVM